MNGINYISITFINHGVRVFYFLNKLSRIMQRGSR